MNSNVDRMVVILERGIQKHWKKHFINFIFKKTKKLEEKVVSGERRWRLDPKPTTPLSTRVYQNSPTRFSNQFLDILQLLRSLFLRHLIASSLSQQPFLKYVNFVFFFFSLPSFCLFFPRLVRTIICLCFYFGLLLFLFG